MTESVGLKLVGRRILEKKVSEGWAMRKGVGRTGVLNHVALEQFPLARNVHALYIRLLQMIQDIRRETLHPSTARNLVLLPQPEGLRDV